MDIINLQQIVWQAINFFILYLVISKFIVPPTKKFIAQREQEIGEGLANAELVKKQLAEAETSKQEILESARVEGKKIVEEMKVKADELSKKMSAEARSRAQEETARLIAQAESDMARQRAEIDSQIVALAKIVAQKALSESLTDEMQHSVIQKQLDQIKKSAVQI